ncbi:MAG: hypothetical protein ACE5JP_10920 [Candidatus Bipolaricaulia bacterium]
MKPRYRIHFPLMGLGMIALLTALWAGLVRLGWRLPSLQSTLPIAHGPLFVSGFLGTLIGLERAVALGRRWTYAVPLLTGLGALTLSIGLSDPLSPLLITLGSLGFVVFSIVVVRRQPALFTVTMELGAMVWLVGNALWLSGWPIYRVGPWWTGFLVLTIAGERLELAQLLRLSGTGRATFLFAIGLFLSGLALTGVAFDVGVRLTGVSMIALTLWLLVHDIVRYTVRKAGLTRFTAICLLAGYLWLGTGGGLGLLFGGVVAGPHYDALLHAFFLGFVFSMIFGHAPIIFPAVLGLSVPFRPTFYAHLILLHLSLLLRVVGDLVGWLSGRQWGGLLNVVVLLLFLVNTARSVRQGNSLSAPRRGRR